MKKLSQRALLLAAVFMTGFAGAVQAQDSIAGDWEGTLTAPGAEFPLVLHVTQGDDGTLAVTLDSPSQGAFGMAADTAEFMDGSFKFTIASIGGSYEATLGEDGTLSGSWSQGGASLPLEFTRSEG